MAKTTVYKDGKSATINTQYSQGYTNSGWTTSPSSGGQVLGASTSALPARNDNQAYGGAGYTELTRLSSTGSVNPDSVQASNSLASPKVNLPSTKPKVNLPSTNIVNLDTLSANNTKLNIADPAITKVPTINPIDQTALDATKKKDTSFEDYLSSVLNNQPSSADAYNQAQKQSGYLQAQQQVNGLTGQLNQIVSTGQANQLYLVGQGRGIPEAIIGGQQAQIARETAIQALPVQAQLAAAQGNLEIAKSNLDTLFKIYSDDATNAYNNRVAVKKAVFDYASGAEKKALEAQSLQEQRSYNQTLNLQKQAQDYANMAFDNGQSSLGAKISTLAQNVGSPTYSQDLAKLQSQLRDPVKVAQLSKLNMEIGAMNQANKVAAAGGANENLTAYASRYADTGTLPNPAELKLSGLTVGQVTMMAKQMPRPEGAIVATNTGTKSTTLSPVQEDAIIAARDADKKLARLQELYNSRTITIPFSKARTEFKAIQDEFVDLLARSRTGAVINDEEAAKYEAKIPGITAGGFRSLGNVQFNTLRSTLSGKLDTTLKSQGVSVYGYSQVQVGNTQRTVGEVIDIGGVNYRVLPDGSLTDIL